MDQTKARLLEAAGHEFSEKGFEGATVRAICDRAGANLAAVNYHFGDKEQLYVETVLEAHRCGDEEMHAESIEDLPAAEAFTQHVRFFLQNVVALREEKWHHALMLREMMNPTAASKVLVDETIRPRFARLSAIIRRLCPEADERRVIALAFSVVGQCLHYKVSRPISERIVGVEAFAGLDLDYLADHISRFTLAAIGIVPPIENSSPNVEATAANGGGRG